MSTSRYTVRFAEPAAQPDQSLENRTMLQYVRSMLADLEKGAAPVIPYFPGNGQHTFAKWRAIVGLVTAINGWSEERIREEIVLAFGQEDRIFFHRLSRTHRNHVNILLELQKRKDPRWAASRVADEILFHEIRQMEGETIAGFHSRVALTGAKVFEASTTNALWLRSTFVFGLLDSDLVRRLNDMNPISFNEALYFCHELLDPARRPELLRGHPDPSTSALRHVSTYGYIHSCKKTDGDPLRALQIQEIKDQLKSHPAGLPAAALAGAVEYATARACEDFRKLGYQSATTMFTSIPGASLTRTQTTKYGLSEWAIIIRSGKRNATTSTSSGYNPSKTSMITLTLALLAMGLLFTTAAATNSGQPLQPGRCVYDNETIKSHSKTNIRYASVTKPHDCINPGDNSNVHLTQDTPFIFPNDQIIFDMQMLCGYFFPFRRHLLPFNQRRHHWPR